MDEIVKKFKELKEELDRRQLLTTDKPIGKVIATNVSESVGRRMAEGLGYNCRCDIGPLGTPRNSGRYPWGENRAARLPACKPSPGFIFANVDFIRSNTSVHYDIKSGTNTFSFSDRDNGLDIRMVADMDDIKEWCSLYRVSDEVYEEQIIYDIAHKYDKMIIRKVFDMDSTRFNRFVSMLNAAGGHFSMESSADVNPMVRIEVPYRMMERLHIDGDGSLKEPSRHSGRYPLIPNIARIRVFNDRAVQITFIDGSQTKCVCGKDETFDLYEGIAFCLFKRFLGKEKGHKHFNDLMHYAMKKLAQQEEFDKKIEEARANNKRKEEKRKLQAQRRKDEKREENIGIFVEALKWDRESVVKPDENPEKEN